MNLTLKSCTVYTELGKIFHFLFTFSNFSETNSINDRGLSLPWNQNTPIGYITTMVYSISSSESYFLLNGSILLLFISMCLHHRAFYRRFEYSLDNLDNLNQKTNSNQEFSELIDFHNSITQ